MFCALRSLRHIDNCQESILVKWSLYYYYYYYYYEQKMKWKTLGYLVEDATRVLLSLGWSWTNFSPTRTLRVSNKLRHHTNLLTPWMHVRWLNYFINLYIMKYQAQLIHFARTYRYYLRERERERERERPDEWVTGQQSVWHWRVMYDNSLITSIKNKIL